MNNRLASTLLLLIITSFNAITQQFEQPQHILGHTVNVSDYAHADIDGDGDEDMLVSSIEDVRWIENDGNGNFFKDHYINSSPLYEASFVSSADLNGDQFIDVLVYFNTPSNNLVWYANDGAGNFSAAEVLIPEVNLRKFETCDLDGDMDNDLVLMIGNPINQMRIYENDGTAAFTLNSTLNNAGDFMSDFSCGDLYGSELPDLVVCSLGDDKIAYYENLGGLSFAPQNTITTQSDYPQNIQLADITGNGSNDVVCYSAVDQDLAWYENIGDGSFGTEQIVMSGLDGVSFQAKDLNGDAAADIVSFSFETEEVVELHLNTGSGMFSPPQEVSENRGAFHIDVFDLDSDSDLDVVYTGYNSFSTFGNLYSIQNDDNTGFLAPTIISYALKLANSISTGDLDGDGWQDVLSVSSLENRVYWNRNMGGGTFSHPIILSDSINNAFSVLAVDLDLDNDLDVLAVERGYNNLPTNNRVHVYENDGSGNFTLATMLAYFGGGGDAEYGVVLAEDITGNGFPDIIINQFEEGEGGHIFKHDNNGGMSFSEREEITETYASVQHIEIGDINGDSFPDLVFQRIESGELFWMENNGSGDFSPYLEIYYPSGLPLYISGFNLELADLDGDLDNDIIVSAKTSGFLANDLGFVCLINEGDATFENYFEFVDIEMLAYDTEVADLDGDNDLDIAVIDIYGTSWLRNNGANDFELLPIDSLSTGQISPDGVSYRAIQLADLDNDSDLDVVYTNLQGSTARKQVKWSANNAINCSTLPSVSSNSSNSICPGTAVTLTAEGGTDFIWNNGLSNQASHEVSPSEQTTYEVIISGEENCTYTASITINMLELPEVTTQDMLVCPGSEVQLNATEGGTYMWSPQQGLDMTTISNPIATATEDIVYTVEMTSAEGCLNTGSIAIEVDTPVEIVLDNTALCPGESVTLEANEASTYTWSPEEVIDQVNSANPMATIEENTQIFLTATSQTGCTYEDSITLHVHIPMELEFTNETSLCPETCIELEPANAAAITNIVWSPSVGISNINIANPVICPSMESTYTIDFTDENNCVNQAQIELLLFTTSSPEVSFDSNLLSSSEGETYQWFINGEPIAGATEESYVPAENGNYTVQTTDSNGCENNSDSFEVTTISVNEHMLSPSWQLYPTWSGEQFELVWKGEGQPKGALYVTDMNGKTLLVNTELPKVLQNSDPLVIETYGWSVGIYILTIVEDGRVTFTQKLAKD